MILLSDLLAANPTARIHGQTGARRFGGFSFDSRIVREGELFVAFRTARADGHDFVAHACRKGAAGVLSHVPVDLSDFGATCVVVPDSEEAVHRYAMHMVRSTGVRVVGIGGSVGKTSTKEAVAAVLATAHRVFRNPANHSGRFGLPIALGGLARDHEMAVLEMASGHVGETGFMAQIVAPTIGVVTGVTPVHMATFGTLDAVAKEYTDLVASLPEDGLAVLNADDPQTLAMASFTRAAVLTYGFDAEATYRVRDVLVDPEGTSFVIEAPDGSMPARIPWVGGHFARAALAAVIVGARLGITLQDAVPALSGLPAVPGRLRPLPGRKGTLILDDTYNSSPAAVMAALDVLGRLSATTRIAVLGDMAELGDSSEREHRGVGRRVAAVADLLVTRGTEAAWIAEEARASGLHPDRVAVTYAVEDAVAAVEPRLGEGAVVLAKGSTATRMEHVVSRLLRDPRNAPDMLVRQDAAWRELVLTEPDRPTWLEIDHSAIARNARRLKEIAGRAALMAVLKADAYGHGATRVAHTALNNGASWCGVACLTEAEALRRAGIDAPILVLGYTPGWQARQAVRLAISVTVFDMETAGAFSRAAQAVDGTARLHLKVDTGMHRLGLPPEEAPGFLSRLGDLPRVSVEGLFTHMAAADDLSPEGRSATEQQLARFRELVGRLADAGLRPPIVHAANSATLLTRPDARYDLVRAGVALYGLRPSPEISSEGLRPALAWKSQLAQVRVLAAGEAVGYGYVWAAHRPSRIATVPVGYADGFRRSPSSWRHVLVGGRPAPVVGRVSMDQATIDVTDIPQARQGDEVVLIGEQGGGRITVEDVAGWLGTNAYEVVAEILPRVPRVS